MTTGTALTAVLEIVTSAAGRRLAPHCICGLQRERILASWILAEPTSSVKESSLPASSVTCLLGVSTEEVDSFCMMKLVTGVRKIYRDEDAAGVWTQMKVENRRLLGERSKVKLKRPKRGA